MKCLTHSMKRQFTNNELTGCDRRYKFMNGYFPDIMNDVFHLRQNTYSLRNFHAFPTDVPRNNCMFNSVVYRANQLWATLPFDLKN